MKEHWVQEDFGGDLRFGLAATAVLFDRRSAFQRVLVVDTPRMGRTLLLDGCFMTSERDEHHYHEMLVHPAMTAAPRIERVLVVGGGDGGTAREVLRHPEVKSCVMVEIDPVVIEASRECLPTIGSAFDDPRLELRVEDAIAYVAREESGTFDVILVDGTDPVGPAEGLFNEAFYRSCAARLAPGGVLALQSESPVAMEGVFLDVVRTLDRVFPRVHPYFGGVPIYPSGQWSFTFCSRTVDPLAIDPARADRVEAVSKKWTRDLSRGAFAIPNALRKALGPRVR